MQSAHPRWSLLQRPSGWDHFAVWQRCSPLLTSRAQVRSAGADKLQAGITRCIAWCNSERHDKVLDNVTPGDACFGRREAVLWPRAEPKGKTENRHWHGSKGIPARSEPEHLHLDRGLQTGGHADRLHPRQMAAPRRTRRRIRGIGGLSACRSSFLNLGGWTARISRSGIG